MTTCVHATFIMPEISKLTAERSKSTGESFLAWYDALTKGSSLANNAGIDPDAFLIIANNSSKSSQFLLIMEALNGYAKENPYGENAYNLVAHYIDKSHYSIRDWVDVIDYFYTWLSNHYRHASLATVLSYIGGCASDKGAIKFNNSGFIEIVEKVLGTYGFQD